MLEEEGGALREISTPDLGGRRGVASDWATQRWVQATGRRVSWEEHPWLEAPVGDTRRIGTDFFRRYAERQGLEVVAAGPPRGLLDRFADLEGPSFRSAEVAPAVAGFYEQTSEYGFDVWSEWSGAFKPFGGLLAALFSRRLQQLNVPLSPLETRLGITSEVLKLKRPAGGIALTAWVRESVATRRTLYAGSYSACRVPGFEGPCVKVAFPLPNGYALVVMRPALHPDGSVSLHSDGAGFGDPGFYFYVESAPGHGWARYVASLKESIHVFVDPGSVLRADHELELWGRTFLRLHYRMERAAPPVAASA